MHKQSEKIIIDLNTEFTKAFSLMNDTDKNIFIMGKAGTGKSTLLNYFRENTKKNVAILAPTGIAAVNIKGQTIHSFFSFKPNTTLSSVKKLSKEQKKSKLYKKLETIVIDEISMVRADIMDCMDKFMRLNGNEPSSPFGGVQMIFIGDLYQLPPVVTKNEQEIFRDYYKTPYFFSGNYFDDYQMEMVELEKIYRQNDLEFIDVLNAIRNNTVTSSHLSILNKRVDSGFIVPKDEFYINLLPTNSAAGKINQEELLKLDGRAFSFIGETTGEFDKSYFPTAIDLDLKENTQIMMVNNDPLHRWINGTIVSVNLSVIFSS